VAQGTLGHHLAVIGLDQGADGRRHGGGRRHADEEIMMLKALGPLAVAVALLALPGSDPAAAQPRMPGFHGAEAACRHSLPVARRFVGRHETLARARFGAPAGVAVRYCAACTRDFRPNRLTFGLDRRGMIRSASCG
jgi:hypothetical protein